MTDATTTPTDKAGEPVGANGVPWPGDDARWDDVRASWESHINEHVDDNGKVDVSEIETAVGIAMHRAFILSQPLFTHPQPSLSAGLDREATDWEAAADSLCGEMLNQAPGQVRKVADALYETLLDTVQDYLRDNVGYNLSGELRRAKDNEATANEALRSLALAMGVDVASFPHWPTPAILSEQCVKKHSATLALAAPAEGYVLVPVEPTEAMIEAGEKAAWDDDNAMPAIRAMPKAYRAMIAACLPAAPTGEGKS